MITILYHIYSMQWNYLIFIIFNQLYSETLKETGEDVKYLKDLEDKGVKMEVLEDLLKEIDLTNRGWLFYKFHDEQKYSKNKFACVFTWYSTMLIST